MTFSILFSSRALQNFLEILAGIGILLALLRPRLGRSLFRRIESTGAELARDPVRAILTAALFPLIVRALLLPVYPIPYPRVHDEFSYLLLGDTLAHGRLANPTPPFWQHFETEYELMLPVYASQYEPGQGFALATGQLAAGHPWWGVWFSMGLMFGAVCWALTGIVRPSWALAGSLLAALQFGIFGFWMNGYFGGAVAGFGGALVFGSLVRKRYPALCALGLIILFATRPAEAILWSLATLILTVRCFRPKAVLAFLLVFGTGAAALAYYNFRVTGNPIEPPYLLYRQIYGTPQSFFWQPPVLVSHFNNRQLEQNYEDQLDHWKIRDSPNALWNTTWRRARDFWRFFIGPFLTPALLFAGVALRRRRLRPWLWLSALFVLDHATFHAWYPQQSASETVLIVLILIECWRRLRVWHRQRGLGLAMSRQLAAAFALAILALGAGKAFERQLPPKAPNIWASLNNGPLPRDIAIEALAREPGQHLVFVHYAPDHRWYDEWVFNAADIPASRIVFARMLSPESDLALVRAMPERDVWIADPDRNTLSRYQPWGY